MKRYLIVLALGLTACGTGNRGFYTTVKDCNETFAFGQAEYAVTTMYNGQTAEKCTFQEFNGGNEQEPGCTIITPDMKLVFSQSGAQAKVVRTDGNGTSTFNYVACSTSPF